MEADSNSSAAFAQRSLALSLNHSETLSVRDLFEASQLGNEVQHHPT